jgi:capsular polysaccharide biosynthesis protein
VTGSPANPPEVAPAARPRLNGGRPAPPRRRPWRSTAAALAGLAAVGAAAGAGYALTAEDRYLSRAYVLVSAPAAVADNGSAVGLAHAYARVALQQPVVGRALAARGLAPSTDAVRRSLSVGTSPDAPIIEIDGHAGTAAESVELADTASRAFVSYLAGVGRDTGYRLTLLAPAASADAPDAPGLPLSIAVGAAAGGLLGAGWRLLRANG